MSEKIRAVIDAMTAVVFSYHPLEKGLAAKKAKRRLAKKAKADE